MSYFLIIGILFISPAYCSDLFVLSVKAPLYIMPDLSSEKIIDVEKGTKLVKIKKKANWYNIKYNNNTAWVYKFMVGEDPPLSKKAIYNNPLADQYNNFSSKARRRPSSFTSAAAARGLKEMRRRYSNKYYLDYKGLEKIESLIITDEQAWNFLNRGFADEN